MEALKGKEGKGIYFRGTGTTTWEGLIINMKLCGEVEIDESLFGRKIEMSKDFVYNSICRDGNRCGPVL